MSSQETGPPIHACSHACSTTFVTTIPRACLELRSGGTSFMRSLSVFRALRLLRIVRVIQRMPMFRDALIKRVPFREAASHELGFHQFIMRTPQGSVASSARAHKLFAHADMDSGSYLCQFLSLHGCWPLPLLEMSADLQQRSVMREFANGCVMREFANGCSIQCTNQNLESGENLLGRR